MRVKINTNSLVTKNLFGMEFNTIPCPIKQARLYLHDFIWIDTNPLPLKILRQYVEIIDTCSYDEKRKKRESALKNYSVSEDNLPIVLDRSEPIYDEFLKLYTKCFFVHDNKVYRPFKFFTKNDLNSSSSLIFEVKYLDRIKKVIFKEVSLPISLIEQKTAQEAIYGWLDFYKDDILKVFLVND